jgi:hypothetical protein
VQQQEPQVTIEVKIKTPYGDINKIGTIEKVDLRTEQNIEHVLKTIFLHFEVNIIDAFRIIKDKESEQE